MHWTDTHIGSALHDDAGHLLAKVRPLGAGGVSAQWLNSMTWDVSDQAKLVREPQSSRWFTTVPEAKQAIEAALKTMGAIEISDKDFMLLKTVNNLRRVGHPVPSDIAAAASSLVASGLIAVDEDGHFVPDDVKWKLVADQRPLK